MKGFFSEKRCPALTVEAERALFKCINGPGGFVVLRLRATEISIPVLFVPIAKPKRRMEEIFVEFEPYESRYSQEQNVRNQRRAEAWGELKLSESRANARQQLFSRASPYVVDRDGVYLVNRWAETFLRLLTDDPVAPFVGKGGICCVAIERDFSLRKPATKLLMALHELAHGLRTVTGLTAVNDHESLWAEEVKAWAAVQALTNPALAVDLTELTLASLGSYVTHLFDGPPPSVRISQEEQRTILELTPMELVATGF